MTGTSPHGARLPIARVTLGALFAVLALVLGGCGGRLGPSWETEITLPLVAGQRIDAAELLGSVALPDGDRFRYLSESVETFAVDLNNWETEIAPFEERRTLDPIHLENLLNIEVTFPIFPGMNFADDSVPPEETEVDAFSAVAFAASPQTALIFTVRNRHAQTDVEVLEVRLRNANTGAVVAQGSLAPGDKILRGGGSRQIVVDLSGASLPSELGVDVAMSTSGPVNPLLTEPALDVDLDVPDAYIARMTGWTEPLEKTEDVVVPLDEMFRESGLESLTLSDGWIDLELDFEALGVHSRVAGATIGGSPLDVEGHRISLAGATLRPADSLVITVDLFTDAVTTVDLTKNYGVRVEVGELAVAGVVGAFDGLTVIVDETEVPLDWDPTPLHLTEALLSLEVDVPPGAFPLTFSPKLDMRAYRDETHVFSGVLTDAAPLNVAAAFAANANRWLISGEGRFESPVSVPLMGGDVFTLTMRLEAPLTFEVAAGGMPLVTRPQQVAFSRSERESLRRSPVESFRLGLEFRNHLPIGLSGAVYLSRSEERDGVTEDERIGTLSLAAAPVGEGQRTTGVTPGMLLVGLTAEQKARLTGPDPLWLHIDAKVDETDGSITFYSSDYLAFSGWISARVAANR